MSLIKIPISSDPDNTQVIVLEDVSYNLRIQWNTRDESWHAYIGLLGQDFKIKFKMTVGLDLLNPYRGYDEVPDGTLAIIDTERAFGRVGRDNFGIDRRFELWYETSDGTILDPLFNP